MNKKRSQFYECIEKVLDGFVNGVTWLFTSGIAFLLAGALLMCYSILFYQFAYWGEQIIIFIPGFKEYGLWCYKEILYALLASVIILIGLCRFIKMIMKQKENSVVTSNSLHLTAIMVCMIEIQVFYMQMENYEWWVSMEGTRNWEIELFDFINSTFCISWILGVLICAFIVLRIKYKDKKALKYVAIILSLIMLIWGIGRIYMISFTTRRLFQFYILVMIITFLVLLIYEKKIEPMIKKLDSY